MAGGIRGRLGKVIRYSLEVLRELAYGEHGECGGQLYRWSGRRISALERPGVPPAQPHPAEARFKFGNGRLGGVQYGADTPAGIARGRGKFTAISMDADIPALLSKGAPGASGG